MTTSCTANAKTAAAAAQDGGAGSLLADIANLLVPVSLLLGAKGVAYVHERYGTPQAQTAQTQAPQTTNALVTSQVARKPSSAKRT